MPVTCGPVYVVQDSSILCGRCHKLAKDHYRNYSYEALGSVFLYPCENWRNHCPMKLRWNDSLEHEEECKYIGCCSFFCSHPGAFFKGKRSIPHDEIRLVLVPDDLLEYIKCELCESYLSCAPVYIQTNGKNICHRCVHANGTPPNCRRNYAYENFSKLFVFPCIYKNRGCSERMPFGNVLWQHESECHYGVQYKKKPQPAPQPQTHTQPQAYTQAERINGNMKQKEKGLIKTQTGVIWATITPNSDTSKQLIKSITKRQTRNIRRADDIGNDMGKGNSDSESVSTNDSFSLKNSIGNSGQSTPDPLDPSRRPLPPIPPEDYNGRPVAIGSRPGSRESGYHTVPYQDDQESSNGSVRNSMRPAESFRETPVAGNFPILVPHRLNDNFDAMAERVSYRESFRESYRGNNSLINELKVKQDIIKRTQSIKGEQDLKNSYRNNNSSNNLEGIREDYRQVR